LGIETGYGLDGRGSIPGRGKRFFFTPWLPDRLWGPTNLLYSWDGRLFPSGVKWPERETDSSPPSSAKVKNGHLHDMVLN
jgi:hypothetical protein